MKKKRKRQIGSWGGSKMKTIIALVSITLMLSGVMTGCQSKTVSVGPMTVTISAEWERVPKPVAEAPPEEEMLVEEGYNHKSGEAILFVGVWDIGEWEAIEAQGVTKEFVPWMMLTRFLDEVEELSRKVYPRLTIHGNEAWESQLTGKLEGEPMRVGTLYIYGPYGVGMLTIMVKEAAWEKFEGTWAQIRDSAEFSPEAE